MSDKPIRTRFAPSPTGFIHVGNLRTALFAWLTAQKDTGGSFILRIEDTDQKREVTGAIDHIIESLKSLDLDYSEGPDIGGPHAPYIQSQRLDIYKKWANKLIESGRAYADPYSQEQIDQFRNEAAKAKKPFLYRNHRPDNPPVWDGTTPLRFKSDPKDYSWHDAVMGNLSAGKEAIDDFILIKSDGFPTYNFAHIVDDAEMEITHIIRGQEFISSTPNYLNLYEALGLNPPIFASMPHVMAESGNKKLGKRDGAKDILEYFKEGYLKETLVNFIASMGWNDGSEQELFTIEELINKFSIERVQQSGARFDNKRLLWMNGQWIRRLNLDELYERCHDFWPASAQQVSIDDKKEVLSLIQDRLKTLSDLPVLSDYFFREPVPDIAMISDNQYLSDLDNDQLKALLQTSIDALENTNFESDDITAKLNELLNITQQKPAVLFSLIRLCVSWSPFSPSLDQTLKVLGKDKTIARLKRALDSL